jgi:putative transposase
MRCTHSIFASLLKPIERGVFAAIVAGCDGDAYDKSFTSWAHVVVLVFAQLSGCASLRGLEAVWNAHPHPHLGCRRLARSTLADANTRRPVAVFAGVLGHLAAELDRKTRQEACAMLRLIDASPIPLAPDCHWAKWNGRIKGFKLHLVYDPGTDCPRQVSITPATVNDIEIGRTIAIETGATYVFDKGYCRFAWWSKIAAKGAFFVTRPKRRMRWKTLKCRPLRATDGDSFTVIADTEVALASKGDSKLAMPLRLITVQRDSGERFAILSNDRRRSALTLAGLYKARWQIELVFRWLKQHLKLRRFMAVNDNAIRLQILAAMIAFVLLRLAQRRSRLAIPALRFRELVTSCLFTCKPLARLNTPPPRHIGTARAQTNPNQRQPRHA